MTIPTPENLVVIAIHPLQHCLLLEFTGMCAPENNRWASSGGDLLGLMGLYMHGGVETTDEGGDAGEDHSESPAVPVDVAAESADDESNGGETENVASGDVTETDDVTENDGEDEVASSLHCLCEVILQKV